MRVEGRNIAATIDERGNRTRDLTAGEKGAGRDAQMASTRVIRFDGGATNRCMKKHGGTDPETTAMRGTKEIVTTAHACTGVAVREETVANTVPTAEAEENHLPRDADEALSISLSYGVEWKTTFWAMHPLAPTPRERSTEATASWGWRCDVERRLYNDFHELDGQVGLVTRAISRILQRLRARSGTCSMVGVVGSLHRIRLPRTGTLHPFRVGSHPRLDANKKAISSTCPLDSILLSTLGRVLACCLSFIRVGCLRGLDGGWW